MIIEQMMTVIRKLLLCCLFLDYRKFSFRAVYLTVNISSCLSGMLLNVLLQPDVVSYKTVVCVVLLLSDCIAVPRCHSKSSSSIHSTLLESL